MRVISISKIASKLMDMVTVLENRAMAADGCVPPTLTCGHTDEIKELSIWSNVLLGNCKPLTEARLRKAWRRARRIVNEHRRNECPNSIK